MTMPALPIATCPPSRGIRHSQHLHVLLIDPNQPLLLLHDVTLHGQLSAQHIIGELELRHDACVADGQDLRGGETDLTLLADVICPQLCL